MRKLCNDIANSQGVVWMLVILLFSSTALKAQTSIPDPNFAAAIRGVCPTCIDANNRLLAPAATLTSLNVANKNISSLAGIQSFTSLKQLNCSNNQLTTLTALPSGLQYVDLYNNRLTSLPVLPNGLVTLICPLNQLISLPELPNGLQNLQCYDNRLTSLPALPNGLITLNCNNNQLISLPTLPNGLQYLVCHINRLVSLPTLPNGLQELSCYQNQIYCLSSLPNGLKFLRIDEDRVICLPSNPAGIKIYGRNDNLISLPICTGMSISTTNTSGICPGNSVDLFASKCREMVKWSDGQTGNSITVKPTVTTTYTATCINICGTVESNPLTIKVNNAIPQPTITGNNAFCAEGSTTLNSGVTGSYSYQWKRDGQNVSNNSTLNANEVGNYTVEVSSNGCSATSAGFSVQKSQPSVKITGDLSYCQGRSTTLNAAITLTADKPITTFYWEKNGENIGENASRIVPNGAGSYRITITDQIGCKAISPAVDVIENPRPVFRLPPLRNLTGTETELVQAIPVSYTTGPYSYNWTTEPNVNASVTNDRYDAPTFGPFTQNTSIKLRVTDAKGCESEEVRTLLTYIPCTMSAGIQSQSFFFCKGSLPLVSTVQNGNGDYSYQWRKNNNPIGSSTSTLDVTEGGQYSVVITDRKGCRSTSGTVNVTKGNPTVQITGKLEFCAGGSTLLKTTTQNAKFPISYRWINGTNSDSLRVAAAGSYTVDITDAQGCSATSVAVTVVQNPLPIASAGLGKSVTCAETYALTGVSTASGGAGNYQYAWNSSPAVAIQGATTAQPTLGPFIENTTVSVRVTDAKGCVGTAQSTVTYIPPDLNVSLIGASEFCSGKSVPLKAIIEKANLPLKQLVWYNGTQEVKHSVNDSPTTPIEWITNQKGSYTVFVEDNKGCRKTSAVLNVVENPTPNVRIQGSSFFCYGNTTTLIGEINGGTLPFKHQWKLNGIDTGNDSPNLTTDREGRYEMLLIDAKGCSAEAPSFNLVEKGGEIIADVVAQGALSVFAPEKVLLSAAIGNEYQYQWARDKTKIQGATAATFLAEQSGDYTVTVSRKECSRTSSAVTVKIETPTSVPNAQTPQWLIWPNPIQNVLNIRAINQVGGVFQVWIVDGSGRVIHERQFTNQKEVNISSQDWGIGKYTLKIVTTSSQVSASILKAN